MFDFNFPPHWKIIRLKNLFSFGKGLPITKENLVENGVPVISYGQVHAKNNSGTTIKDDLIRFVPESYLKTNSSSLVNEFDFIFADTSEDLAGVGNCVYVDKEMDLFAGYHTITLKAREKTDNKYLAYLFLTDDWRYQLRSRVSGVKVFSITKKILSQVYVILPPLDEQEKIVRYLDKKTAQISTFLDAKKKEVELLDELKRAIISEAVNKNSPHWQKIRLKYLFEIKNGATPSSFNQDYWDGEITWITPADFMPEQSYISQSKRTITKKGLHSCGTNLVPKDSIIISTRAPIGSVALAGVDLCTNQGCKSLVNKSYDVSPKFFYYYFSTQSENLNALGRGTTFLELSTFNLANIKIPVPPIDEQVEIANYLDEKCAKIEKLRAGLQDEIKYVEELRTRIISDVVTGQLDVRELV